MDTQTTINEYKAQNANQTETWFYDMMMNWNGISKTATGDLKQIADALADFCGEMMQAIQDKNSAAKQAARDAKATTGAIAQAAKLGISIDKLCPYCGGTGRLPHYSHVLNGKCFHCNGTGISK